MCVVIFEGVCECLRTCSNRVGTVSFTLLQPRCFLIINLQFMCSEHYCHSFIFAGSVCFPVPSV